MLSLGTKLRFTLYILNQKNPESWAPLIERKQIKTAAFYTPQMLVFAMSDSFKKSNLSSLMQFATGQGSKDETDWSRTERFGPVWSKKNRNLGPGRTRIGKFWNFLAVR